MKIPFKGIVKNTPAGLAQDGELEDVCNLRYKDGAWRPIPERNALFNGETLPYTNIFVHSNAGYKHYLGLKVDGTFEYFAKDNEDNIPEILATEDIQELTTLTTGATFTQIGNVININDNGLKYLIWYDNAYVLIDSNFDGAQDSTTVGVVKVDLKVDGEVDENGVRQWRSVFSTTLPDYTSASNFNSALQTRKDLAKGLYTMILSKDREFGRINGYCMACTAVELYDGSYILHSNPVLLGKSWDIHTRYNRNGRDYLTNPDVFLVDYYNTNTPPEYDNDNPHSGLAWSDTNNTGLVEPPDLVAGVGYGDNAGVIQMAVTASSNNLKFKITNNIPINLKPLIKSVSIFLSPEVDLFKNDTITSKQATGGQNGIAFPFSIVENYYFNPKTNAEILKELSELKNFYKVHEIPFEQIQAGDWTTIDLKDKLGDRLLTLQPLPIDNYSHHTTLPEVQFVYNSKLHIANYKTELSRGWPVSYFYPQNGIGQFQADISEVSSYVETIYACVDIKTQTGISRVIRITNYTGTFSKTNQFLMLSYPDSRATKLTIYRKKKFNNSSDWYYFKEEYQLTASNAHNFAYYINPEIKPDYASNVIQLTEFTTPTEANRILIYQNTLKVSEVNNPFIFPAANTYQVGNGDIIGLATNTIALSTGQFGQFPVYVFCTDGIYGLYVGGAEVNYSSSRPVSREVCNNPHSIKAIDTGVIFSTDKGIMVLVGSEVKELSEPLRGGIFDINKLSLFKQALNHAKLTTLLHEITKETLHDFMDNANVGYNYTEREIWFTNPELPYSYIFSQGAWYKVKQSGARFIDDYPKQYILEEGKLIDIASETGTYQQVYILTRPIKMGDVEFKQMLTSVIRGRILVENTGTAPTIQKKWAGIHVYGSYDGERWVFLGGNEKNGELNDFGTRVERTDCKYFRIAFYGNINNDSTINYLELEGKQSILSTKLR